MLSADKEKIITQEILEQAFKELGEMRDAVAKERGRQRKEPDDTSTPFYG